MEFINASLVEGSVCVHTDEPLEFVDTVTFREVAEPFEKVAAHGRNGVLMALLIFVKQSANQDESITLAKIALLDDTAVRNTVVDAGACVDTVDDAIPRFVADGKIVLLFRLEDVLYKNTVG